MSPNNPNSLTIIANYVPLEDPAGGPNFFPFDPAVRYEIHVDNNGDGKGDVNYTFRFKTHPQGHELRGHPDVPLQRRAHRQPDRQQPARPADVLRLAQRQPDRHGRPDPSGQHRTALDPDYAALAASAVKTLGNGTKLFAGQRDDAFFVDLGSIFDLAGLRPFNALHALPLPATPGVDGVSGFNTNSIAIEIPIQTLTRDHALPTGPNDPDADLGIWAAASRKKYRTLNADGTMSPAPAPGSRCRASAIR